MKKIILRPLCARRELEVLKRAPSLLPYLLKQGLEAHDAVALATNACLLFHALEDGHKTPREVLERFSLSEIAFLCEALLQGAPPLDWEIAGDRPAAPAPLCGAGSAAPKEPRWCGPGGAAHGGGPDKEASL